MLKGFKVVLLGMSCLISACAAVPKAGPDKSVEELDKLKTDNKILDGALKRCRERLPTDGQWPTMYSLGFFGNFWIDPAMGKILELKRYGSDAEEQLFIIPRSSRSDPIKFEGKGLRQIEAGLSAIIIYKPPQEPEERRKQQTLIITYSDVRFVILLKPTRY